MDIEQLATRVEAIEQQVLELQQLIDDLPIPAEPEPEPEPEPVEPEAFVTASELTTPFGSTPATTTIPINASGPASVVDVGWPEPREAGETSIASPTSTLFTPAAGFSAAAGYDYVVALDASPDVRDTGRIHLRPQAEPEPAAGGGIPKPLKEVEVKNGSALRAALAGNIAPGTHFVLTKGGDGFPGSYTLNDAGTAENPIYVRGAKGAAVPFKGNLLLRAPFTAVAWLEFVGSGTKVDIGAKFSRVTRCLFNESSSAAIIYLSGRGHGRSRIDHNDFINVKGPPLRSELQGAMEDHRDTRFEYNHVNGHTVYGDNESVSIVQTSEFKDVNLHFLYNLFENCMKGATNQRELISLKTSGGLFKGNTVLKSNRGYISSRHSCRYVFEDNWFEDGSYINVYGDDVAVRNCRSTGLLVRAQRGSAYSGTTIPKGCQGAPKSGRCTINNACLPAHCAARRLLVENSVGDLNLGENRASFDKGSAVPKGIVLKGNDRKAKRWAGCTEIVETGVGAGRCTAKKLTAADVGRDAP